MQTGFSLETNPKGFYNMKQQREMKSLRNCTYYVKEWNKICYFDLLATTFTCAHNFSIIYLSLRCIKQPLK